MEGVWRSTLPNERASILAAAIIVLTAVWFGLSEGISKLLALGISLVAGFVLILLSVSGIIWAKSHVGLSRWRVALVSPLFLAISIFLFSPVVSLTYILSAVVYIHQNEEVFQKTNIFGYSATAFREGLPDGGISIIKTYGLRPDLLGKSDMIQIVGERIRWCKEIRKSYYICKYD